MQDPREEQRCSDSYTRSPRLASSWETEDAVALKKQRWHHWVPSECERREWAKGHMDSRGALIPQVRLKARVGEGAACRVSVGHGTTSKSPARGRALEVPGTVGTTNTHEQVTEVVSSEPLQRLDLREQPMQRQTSGVSTQTQVLKTIWTDR